MQPTMQNETSDHRRSSSHDGASAAGALVPWLLGPLAWAAQENLGYVLVGPACDTGHVWLLHLVSIIAFGISSLGALWAWRAIRRLPRRADAPLPRSIGRRHFVLVVGLAMCLLSSAGIVVASIPALMLDVCTGAT